MVTWCQLCGKAANLAVSSMSTWCSKCQLSMSRIAGKGQDGTDEILGFHTFTNETWYPGEFTKHLSNMQVSQCWFTWLSETASNSQRLCLVSFVCVCHVCCVLYLYRVCMFVVLVLHITHDHMHCIHTFYIIYLFFTDLISEFKIQLVARVSTPVSSKTPISHQEQSTQGTDEEKVTDTASTVAQQNTLVQTISLSCCYICHYQCTYSMWLVFFLSIFICNQVEDMEGL